VVDYNLSHLTQPERQDVVGPIQDDEGLFLFALIRVMRLERILEIGGLDGYSARNFCEAVGPRGRVFTVDVNQVIPVSDHHVTIRKDARDLSAADLDNTPVDLVFFDCHDYGVQWAMFRSLRKHGLITDHTVLAFHDTNLHPIQLYPGAYRADDGWVHQDVERRMVNKFKRLGYDVLALNTSMASHGAHLPFRHGLSVVTKFRPFALTPPDSRSRRAASWLRRRFSKL
jgi:predicted O-methyltransferase YrrM